MKEVVFKIKIDGERIYSVVESLGFPDTLESKFEIIGILENLKNIEMEKIKTKFSSKVNSENLDQGYYKIVQDNEEDDDL